MRLISVQYDGKKAIVRNLDDVNKWRYVLKKARTKTLISFHFLQLFSHLYASQ